MEEQKIITVSEQPIHITTTKGQKDTYGWEISIHGKSVDEILALIDDADTKLKNRYGVSGPA